MGAGLVGAGFGALGGVGASIITEEIAKLFEGQNNINKHYYYESGGEIVKQF